MMKQENPGNENGQLSGRITGTLPVAIINCNEQHEVQFHQIIFLKAIRFPELFIVNCNQLKKA